MLLMARSSRFLTAEWRHLVMLNYEVEPALLEKYVPTGTEIDSWNGRYFVSVVGFLFLRARMLGIPIPFHRDFEEVNLRFYVRRGSEGEQRRGVVFIKEIVPKKAIALIARKVYNENYVAMPMGHDIEFGNGDQGQWPRSVAYRWWFGDAWNRMRAEASGEPYLPAKDSEEQYITEHYWGYAAQPDGSTLEYRVEHPRWRVWQADRAELTCDTERLYGSEFADVLSGPPASALLAVGSKVLVRKGVRIG